MRILSAYDLSRGDRIWIITEAIRSATTLMTPRNTDDEIAVLQTLQAPRPPRPRLADCESESAEEALGGRRTMVDPFRLASVANLPTDKRPLPSASPNLFSINSEGTTMPALRRLTGHQYWVKGSLKSWPVEDAARKVGGSTKITNAALHPHKLLIDMRTFTHLQVQTPLC